MPVTPRQAVRLLTAALTLPVWGVYMAVLRPALAGDSTLVWVAEPLAGLGLAALLALGIAVLLWLGWTNRRRWRAVLRPNGGRVLGALALAFVTPMVVYDGVPWILGPTMIIVSTLGPPLPLLALPVAALAWYPVAGLLISGMRHRWLRFGLFCLMFWSALAAILLTQGIGHFRI